MFSICDINSNQEEETDKLEYSFRLDYMLKQVFKDGLSFEQVIAIVNEIAEIQIPSNYNVKFGNTESFDATGSDEKNFVVGDNLIIFSNPNISEENLGEAIERIKIVLEFQAKKYYDPHYTMGLRLFLYTINAVERTKVGNEYVFKIPDGITIYTDINLPKSGTDTLNLKFPSFWVDGKEYSDKILTLKYKYVNLLAFKFDEFDGTAFEVLKVLYIYRYRKNIDLMLVEDFQNVMKDIALKIMNYEGKLFELLVKIFQDLIYDIELKANTNTQKYGKVLEDMTEVKKSYGEKLVDDAIAEGMIKREAKVRAEGKAEGKAEGIAEGKAEDRLNISKALGISLEQLEELIRKSNPLEG